MESFISILTQYQDRSNPKLMRTVPLLLMTRNSVIKREKYWKAQETRSTYTYVVMSCMPPPLPLSALYMYKIGDVVSVNDDRGEVSKMQKDREHWVEDTIEVYLCMCDTMYMCIYRSYTMACPSCLTDMFLCPHTVSGSTREGGAAIKGCAGGSTCSTLQDIVTTLFLAIALTQ